MSQQKDSPQKSADHNQLTDEELGLAGRTARFFINSPLSPLLYLAMFAMGFMGLILTPRQEDPQISVPMVDIFVQYPGASAAQVAAIAVEPLERIMSDISGLKHVYSASKRGMGMVTLEFDVGQKMGPSLTKVHEKLNSNRDKTPSGVMPPLVKAKGIDDVSAINITLWAKDIDGDGIVDVDDGQLRMLALAMMQSIKQVENTGTSEVIGGRAEQVTVEIYPERLSGYGISLDQVAQAIRGSNSEVQAGSVESGNSRLLVVTGAFLRGIDDISSLVIGNHQGIPVYVHDVASISQGPSDATELVQYYTGVASEISYRADGVPAVTIAIAKKEGSNGVKVAESIKAHIENLKGILIPPDVQVSYTRDYGKTAKDKVNSLMFKLFIATAIVFFLVWLAFKALRPAIVVVLVIPVVLLFTLFYAWIGNYSIDRVSLFALIFSIGILVDDAIVVVENIYRRWLENGKIDDHTAVDAVREVGNPTILATFTVIAALLPMGFVSGMMGPYMGPIPALGSAAMLISLFAAFVFTPWLAYSPWLRPSLQYLDEAEKREHKESEWLERVFRRVLEPLIQYPKKQRLFRWVMWGLFALACSMFYFKGIVVKMLPLDNKAEFSIVIDMPEGTALTVTANLARSMAEELRKLPEVTAVQVYAGTARPFDFNGMVRHYYLRSEPWQGELQVQLVDKSARTRSSHEIALQARHIVTRLMEGTKGNVSIVEMPPGPPVLQSVVAEVHGPSAGIRRKVAEDLTALFAQTDSLTDVDNLMQGELKYWRFNVDKEKADRRGISVDTINRNLSMALGSINLGDVKRGMGHEAINIVIQVPLAIRSEVNRLGDLPIMSNSGQTLPLGELGSWQQVIEDPIIYHKDLRGVEYVTAEVAGDLAAPVYGMFQVEDLLRETNNHHDLTVQNTYWWGPPENDNQPAIEWAGEWTVTFETFRDMGLAFGVALIAIYMLVVWEFGNFRIPALIMAPIPLTLLGIIPAHMIMGAEFTATSMIGWIALAGIIVRNSILLVDFSIHQIQKGESVKEAVIFACKARTRPIVITAFALVGGSSVILTDPIFQGMAISLASGVLVSTLLTLIVIPLGCIKASQDLIDIAGVCGHRDVLCTSVESASPAHLDHIEEEKSNQPSLFMVGWMKLIALMTLAFYLLRAVYILLKEAFLNWQKKRTTPANPPVQPTTEKETTPPTPEKQDKETVAEETPIETTKTTPTKTPEVVTTVEITKKTPPPEKAPTVKPVTVKPTKKKVVKKAPSRKKKVVKKTVVKKAPPKKNQTSSSSPAQPSNHANRRRGIRLKDNSDDDFEL